MCQCHSSVWSGPVGSHVTDPTLLWVHGHWWKGIYSSAKLRETLVTTPVAELQDLVTSPVSFLFGWWELNRGVQLAFTELNFPTAEQNRPKIELRNMVSQDCGSRIRRLQRSDDKDNASSESRKLLWMLWLHVMCGSSGDVMALYEIMWLLWFYGCFTSWGGSMRCCALS